MAKVSARRRKIGNFIGGLLVIAYGWTNLAYYSPTIYSIAQEQTRKRIEWSTDNLRLNDNDILAFVTNKSEEEGQKDIEKIIEESPYEEGWLFLPGIFPENDRWYEIGIKRVAERGKKGGLLARINFDMDYVFRILEYCSGKAENKGLRPCLYHNHPNQAVVFRELRPNKNFPDDYILKMAEKMDNRQPLTSKIIKTVFKDYLNAKPSIGDLDGLVYVTIMTAVKFPEVNWTFKIQSRYGTTEYFLTDEGADHFRTIDHYEDILGTGAVAYYNERGIQLRSKYLNLNFYPKEPVLEERVDYYIFGEKDL